MPPPHLADLLTAAPPHQERDLADWIAQSLPRLGAVRQLFGRRASAHPDYGDVEARVMAHLLTIRAGADRPRLLEALAGYKDSECERRARAVLAKTLYQEYYRFARE